ARLASVGVRPDEIAVVVNSHLHFDHAGNNGAFPKATFVVQADHLAFAKGNPRFPGVYWDIAELTYLPTTGRARIAKGVEVVPTPGHAPGHPSLAATAVAWWIQHHIAEPAVFRGLERFAAATPLALRLHVGVALVWAALAGLLFVPALHVERDEFGATVLGLEALVGVLIGVGLLTRLAAALLALLGVIAM